MVKDRKPKVEKVQIVKNGDIESCIPFRTSWMPAVHCGTGVCMAADIVRMFLVVKGVVSLMVAAPSPS
jgi:hypothetical protein